MSEQTIATTKRKYCLGKTRATHDPRTLMLANYTANLPAPPVTCDWTAKVPSYPMFENDKWGDCTIAAVGHLLQTWTANVGAEVTVTDADITTMYKHFTTPGPENGCNMLSVLKYWKSHGIAGHKIAGYAALQPGSVTGAMDAISLFGGIYLGVELPDFAVQASDLLTVPWVVPSSGPYGNAAPDSNNGHCITPAKYDARNLGVVTWGAVKSMSWEFYKDYGDESYVVFSEDFLHNGTAPNGFDLAALQADLAAVGKVKS